MTRHRLMTIGVALAIVGLGSAPVYWMTSRQLSRARDGWNLTSVLIAATELGPGSPITLKVVGQRSIPQRFAGGRYISPDEVGRVVNSRVKFTLRKGAPVRWVDVIDDSREEVVFFATRALAPGTPLDVAVLEARVIERGVITDSWLTQRELSVASGRAVTLPIEKGDPILWSHLAGAP